MKNVLLLSLLLCAFTLNASDISTPRQAVDLPNIVFIVADDLGWGDVGFLGSEIMTPNLDRLSTEGIILERFYTAPICTPTRAGLLTGRYPDRFGLRNNVLRPWVDVGLHASEVLLPEMLAKAGYQDRAVIGKWHLGHSKVEYHPLRRGFTYFYGHYNGAIDYFDHTREGERDWHEGYETSYDEGYSTDLITAKAVHQIEKYSERKSPFFLYVAYNAPHAPLQAQEEYLSMYGFDKNKPLFQKGKGKGNTARQTYSAMVTNMDDGIGKILETISRLRLEENTLVLFFSDNGAIGAGSTGILRGSKLTEWEGGVRSPAIIKWPIGFRGGRKTGQLTGYVDVAPTILSIVNPSFILEKEIDGINIMPVLKEESNEISREIFIGNGAIIRDEWKLVKSMAVKTTPDFLPPRKINEDMLFNILSDQSESINVRKENPDIYTGLMERIKEYESIQPVMTPPSDDRPSDFRPPQNWEIK